MAVKMMIFVIVFMSALLLPTSHNFPVAKPNCTDVCGSVSIPYPAGTTPECFLDTSLWVTCNYTYNPPKLFWQNSQTEIRDISLEGKMRMMQSIGRFCYGASIDQVVVNTNVERQFPMQLTLSSTANKFTIVGCNADAAMYASGFNRRQVQAGSCNHTCHAAGHVEVNPCTGEGCCQVSIPGDISVFWIYLTTINTTITPTPIEFFNNSCTYAFLVEESAFRSTPQNLIGLMNLQELPVVVDWAVSGNTTCDEAKKNTTGYACVSSFSACYQTGVAAAGYRCRCNQGYQGNPYLINGCQDVDECADTSLNTCSKREYCINTPGSYTCSCPNDYLGNGVRNEQGGGGCTKIKKKKVLYIALGIPAAVITTLLVAAIITYVVLNRRSLQKEKQLNFVQNGGDLLEEKLREMGSDHVVRIFSESDLNHATSDFHEDTKIGEGGFGTVYKGLLQDNTVVAIKKTKRVDSKQKKQFSNEVFVLSQVNHKNIVRLLGCCFETQVPLLVYEFIDNGTLTSHIRDAEKGPLFNWDMRLKIAAETAGALSYLHSGAASTPIIHRDVKSQNILIDNKFSARVSDFGSSKLFPQDDGTQVSTCVYGTPGFLDPEFFKTNNLTEKSDVYSFGVVLLELLTGRGAVDYSEKDEGYLAVYFFDKMEENSSGILDVNIDPVRNMEQIEHVVKLAKECLVEKGDDRPTMKEVAARLEGLIVVENQSSSRARNEDNIVEEMESSQSNGGGDGIVEYDSVAYDSLTTSGGR